MIADLEFGINIAIVNNRPGLVILLKKLYHDMKEERDTSNTVRGVNDPEWTKEQEKAYYRIVDARNSLKELENGMPESSGDFNSKAVRISISKATGLLNDACRFAGGESWT